MSTAPLMEAEGSPVRCLAPVAIIVDNVLELLGAWIQANGGKKGKPFLSAFITPQAELEDFSWSSLFKL